MPSEHPEQGREQRRADPDHQRVAAAVEQPDHVVAAVAVGAEEELALPGRADRHPVEADHVDRLAVLLDRVGEVVLVRRRVGDVLRPQRRRDAGRDQEQEEDAEDEPGLVAAQPPPGELPRARSGRSLFAGLLEAGSRGQEIGPGLRRYDFVRSHPVLRLSRRTRQAETRGAPLAPLCVPIRLYSPSFNAHVE